MTPAELLISVKGWVGKLSGRWAKRFRLDADDIFQEAATMILRQAGSFDPAKGSPTTWAGYAVKSAAYKLARKKPKELGADDKILGSFESRDDWHTWELGFDLETSLDRLPVDERAVIRLRYGLTTEDSLSRLETGEVLGASAPRVGKLEASALDHLRRLFA